VRDPRGGAARGGSVDRSNEFWILEDGNWKVCHRMMTAELEVVDECDTTMRAGSVDGCS
jgi:hypothetical protein